MKRLNHIYFFLFRSVCTIATKWPLFADIHYPINPYLIVFIGLLYFYYSPQFTFDRVEWQNLPHPRRTHTMCFTMKIEDPCWYFRFLRFPLFKGCLTYTLKLCTFLLSCFRLCDVLIPLCSAPFANRYIWIDLSPANLNICRRQCDSHAKAFRQSIRQK